MVKNLNEFVVRINLEGWFVKGYGTCHQGEEIIGDKITPRIVKALEEKDQFKLHGSLAPVCMLRGGTVDELKAALAANVEPGAVQASTQPISKPVEAEKPVVDAKVEIVRTPKPKFEEEATNPGIKVKDEDEDDDKPVDATPKKVKRSRRVRV